MKYLLLALLAMAAAPAADAQPESAYYGLSLGEFDYEEEDGRGGEFLADTVSSYRLMVGYQFMEHLGVEGGYGETGTIRDTAQVPLFGGGAIDVDFRSEFKILTIRLLGILPFDNGISLRGGISYADMRQDITINFGGLGEQSGDVDGNEPAYYVGAQYDWDRIALRLGYEKYDFDGDLDVAETSVTFFYKL
jgi:OOP family OmpA-OmpF porin